MASSAVGGGAHGHAGVVLGLVVVVGAGALPGLDLQRVQRLGLDVRELVARGTCWATIARPSTAIAAGWPWRLMIWIVFMRFTCARTVGVVSVSRGFGAVCWLICD
jgi:hypothetical protein